LQLATLTAGCIFRQATLTISVLIMQWREGAAAAAWGHVCSHVALTGLLVCKICVGTNTEVWLSSLSVGALHGSFFQPAVLTMGSAASHTR
jgi:hypothetical protein